jgi:hypothetical protein
MWVNRAAETLAARANRLRAVRRVTGAVDLTRRPLQTRPMPRRRNLSILAAATLLAATPTAATAKVKVKSYKNCTALNRAFPHGVGRSGAHDETSTGKPVTDFKVSKRLYRANDGKAPRKAGERDLDRDNDGIACEKR